MSSAAVSLFPLSAVLSTPTVGYGAVTVHVCCMRCLYS